MSLPVNKFPLSLIMHIHLICLPVTMSLITNRVDWLKSSVTKPLLNTLWTSLPRVFLLRVNIKFRLQFFNLGWLSILPFSPSPKKGNREEIELYPSLKTITWMIIILTCNIFKSCNVTVVLTGLLLFWFRASFRFR